VKTVFEKGYFWYKTPLVRIIISPYCIILKVPVTSLYWGIVIFLSEFSAFLAGYISTLVGKDSGNCGIVKSFNNDVIPGFLEFERSR